MRLLTSITVAALSGLAAAASQQSADVFILDSKQQQQTSREVPRLPKEVVRHILLQRVSQIHATQRVTYVFKAGLTRPTDI